MLTLLDDLVQEAGELHHYTTIEGLNGIYLTNTIWATHFKYLNDASEFSILHGLLVENIRKELEVLGRTLQPNPSFADFVNKTSKSIPEFAKDHAYGVVDSMYDWDVADAVQNFTPKPAEDAPYVASFCVHSMDDEYTRQNGLLSQWRGYTGTTKYCIVFDAQQMAALLRAEAQRHLWRLITFDRVQYAGEGYRSSETFEALAAFGVRTVLETLFGKSVLIPIEKTDGFELLKRFGLENSILSCAATTKHQSFSEEREFRVVAVRAGPQTIKRAKAKGQVIPNQLVKEMHTREWNGIKVPYIALFDKIGRHLPISRIIVGPSLRQEDNSQMIRRIIPESIPVVRSQIPFVG
jgi:hypothetical protein